MSKRLPSPSVIYRGWLRNIAALALALALAPAALEQQPPQAPQPPLIFLELLLLPEAIGADKPAGQVPRHHFVFVRR